MTIPETFLPWLMVILLSAMVCGLSLFIVYRYTSTTETQDKIHDWGVAKFGPSSALTIAVRMNVEVAELLQQLAEDYGDREDLADLRRLIQRNVALAEEINALSSVFPPFTPDSPKARVECADVHIMLLQVMGYLRGDLNFETDRKMAIVRKRRWARDANGKMQHLDSFRDVGTGIVMWPDLWYVVSDSGSAYTSEGFHTPEAAADWMAEDQQVADFGQDSKPLPATIPDWLGKEQGWAELGACNVLKGEHCRDFFRHQDEDGWKFLNDSDAQNRLAAMAWGGPAL